MLTEAALHETALPWISAGITAVGLVEPLTRAFSARAARKLLERFDDLQRTGAALRSLGSNQGPHAAPYARSEHRALLAIVEDESRLLLAEHVRRTRRHPGSLAFAVVAWLYGVGLIILGIQLLVADASKGPRTGVLIAVVILWSGALFLSVYGLVGAHRRWVTRALRISSGIRDQYTRSGARYSWGRVQRMRRRRIARARIVRLSRSARRAHSAGEETLQ